MKDNAPLTKKRSIRCSKKSRLAQATAVFRFWPISDSGEKLAVASELDAGALHSMSRRGLIGLLFFLVSGVAAFMVQDFNLYKALPEAVLQVLGCPPPATLIHLALTGYSFTVVVPVLIRMATGAPPVVAWHHNLCRAIFYLFYLVSTTLPENFIAVLTIGIILYGMEQAGIWSYMHKHLNAETSA